MVCGCSELLREVIYGTRKSRRKASCYSPLMAGVLAAVVRPERDVGGFQGPVHDAGQVGLHGGLRFQVLSATGLSHVMPGNLAKSVPRETTVRPCSRASAAESGTGIRHEVARRMTRLNDLCERLPVPRPWHWNPGRGPGQPVFDTLPGIGRCGRRGVHARIGDQPEIGQQGRPGQADGSGHARGLLVEPVAGYVVVLRTRIGGIDQNVASTRYISDRPHPRRQPAARLCCRCCPPAGGPAPAAASA